MWQNTLFELQSTVDDSQPNERMVAVSKYLKTDSEGTPRCWWCADDPLYQQYHDQEWGMPTHDDQKLFEKICLEGFQAGLSWITILRKRQNFRAAFDRFQIKRVAAYETDKINALLNNSGIIRHRGKIEATINNAQQAGKLKEEFGSLAAFFWSFEPSRPRVFNAKRAITSESEAMSKALRKRGWKFVGPTTCYSFMQAMGLVNDHHPKCHSFERIQSAREAFRRP